MAGFSGIDQLAKTFSTAPGAVPRVRVRAWERPDVAGRVGFRMLRCGRDRG